MFGIILSKKNISLLKFIEDFKLKRKKDLSNKSFFEKGLQQPQKIIELENSIVVRNSVKNFEFYFDLFVKISFFTNKIK